MKRRALDTSLWISQWMLATAFSLAGFTKLGLSVHHVRAHFGLAIDATTQMVHSAGAFEVAAGLLVVLPSLVRIVPELSVIAAGAIGAAALIGAMQPFTALGTGVPLLQLSLTALAFFVAWGRAVAAPVEPLLDEEEVALRGPDPAQVPSSP